MYLQKTVTIDKPIQFAGIVEIAAINGSIKTADVITSDEGARFCKFTDELLNQYIRFAGGNPSFVERILIIFLQNGTTVIYLNNFDYLIEAKNKTYKKSGDTITSEDIIGIDSIKFTDIDIPNDAGVMVQLSWAGKKCAFYDVLPVLLKTQEQKQGVVLDKTRKISLERVAGIMLSHIAFIELFWITDEEWGKVLDAGWFPFAFLQGGLWKELFRAFKNNKDLEPIIDKIYAKLISVQDEKIALWSKHPLLKGEISFIGSAYQAYKNNNWIATSSIIGPRIEGIMTTAIGKFMKHSSMVDVFIRKLNEKEHQKTILFPHKLQEFYESIVFKNANMMNPDVDKAGLNRHLLGHGRIKAENLDKESATIRLLLLDHISYYYPPNESI